MCLHGVRSRPFAQNVAAPQVSTNRARPPYGDAEAPLRFTVTNEASLHRTPKSFRHEPQVCRVGSFTVRPPGGFSHIPPLLLLLCRLLLRRSFATLAASIVTIVSVIVH